MGIELNEIKRGFDPFELQTKGQNREHQTNNLETPIRFLGEICPKSLRFC